MPAWGTNEPISSAWWTLLSFCSHPWMHYQYTRLPLSSLLRGGHFAAEELRFLNINLLLIPTFLIHPSDKIWGFLSKLRLKLQRLLLINFNPRLQIASLRSKEFYPLWYGCNSLPSKSILSKSKLYCKPPKMEEIKWWVSGEGKW